MPAAHMAYSMAFRSDARSFWANVQTLCDCRLWADVCGPEAPQCQVCGGVSIEVVIAACAAGNEAVAMIPALAAMVV